MIETASIEMTESIHPSVVQPLPRRHNSYPPESGLMKPGEDWRNLASTAERRKIQNRIAQRLYRQ